jgi:hypothetical protein
LDGLQGRSKPILKRSKNPADYTQKLEIAFIIVALLLLIAFWQLIIHIV